MNNKIYISGPITGVDGCEDRFKEVEKRVESPEFFDRYGKAGLYYKTDRFGFKAVSSRVFNAVVRFTKCWWYLGRSLGMMLGCSYVYMMKGWQHSRSARIEHRLANFLGKEIIYEEDWICR